MSLSNRWDVCLKKDYARVDESGVLRDGWVHKIPLEFNYLTFFSSPGV